MRWLYLVIAVVVVMGCAHTKTSEKQDSSTGHMLAWSTPDGVQRLEEADAKADFFALAPQFEMQKNKLSCSLASAVIVLNALRPVETKSEMKTEDPSLVVKKYKRYLPKKFNPAFLRYTQNNFFTPAVNKVKSEAHVYGRPMKRKAKPDYGLQLRQLHKMLQAHNVSSTLRVATEELKDEQVKKEWIENLKNPKDFVIVSFRLQESLVKKGIGHASPLAAYDEDSDSFLILDVHPYHKNWIWVKSDVLIKSLHTFDTVENRGYLLVSEGSK